MSYYEKYLKYKNKYLELKKKISGGYLSDYVLLELNNDGNLINVHYYVYENECPQFYTINNISDLKINYAAIPPNWENITHISDFPKNVQYRIDMNNDKYRIVSYNNAEIGIEFNGTVKITDKINLPNIWNNQNKNLLGTVENYNNNINENPKCNQVVQPSVV